MVLQPARPLGMARNTSSQSPLVSLYIVLALGVPCHETSKAAVRTECTGFHSRNLAIHVSTMVLKVMYEVDATTVPLDLRSDHQWVMSVVDPRVLTRTDAGKEPTIWLIYYTCLGYVRAYTLGKVAHTLRRLQGCLAYRIR